MIKKTLLILTLLLTSCSEQVDLIVYNAEVYTVDDTNTKVTSFAVKDGKFIYVGDDSVTSKYSSPNIINAEGLPVYPGFIDSHAHFYNLGFFNDQVNLKETKSLEEVLKRVMEFNNSNDKDFINKMSVMESTQNNTVVLTIDQARGLRNDIATLLADLHEFNNENKTNEETISVQVKGGSFK